MGRYGALSGIRPHREKASGRRDSVGVLVNPPMVGVLLLSQANCVGGWKPQGECGPTCLGVWLMKRNWAVDTESVELISRTSLLTNHDSTA